MYPKIFVDYFREYERSNDVFVIMLFSQEAELRCVASFAQRYKISAYSQSCETSANQRFDFDAHIGRDRAGWTRPD